VRMRTSGDDAWSDFLAACFSSGRTKQLRPYPNVLTDRLIHWAKVSPEKVCIAKRGPDGGIGAADVLAGYCGRLKASARRARPRSFGRPACGDSVGNDLEHFLLTLAGQHVGIPAAPLSPAYSLVSKDFGKLRHTLKILTPGLVFASDGVRYAPAIEAAVGEHMEVATTTAPRPPQGQHLCRSAGNRSNASRRCRSRENPSRRRGEISFHFRIHGHAQSGRQYASDEFAATSK